MKELNAPWVNWESAFGGVIGHTPGSAELFAKHGALLGERKDAANLEGTVEGGNEVWVGRRVEALRNQSVAELLRPLFCTVDINLETRDMRPLLGGLGGLSFQLDEDADAVDAQRVTNNQLVMDGRNRECVTALAQNRFFRASDLIAAGCTPLKVDGDVIRESFGGLIYPERSHQDIAYEGRLTCSARPGFPPEEACRPVVDAEFVDDVRSIDLTRPIFSKTRCALLAFAPDLPPNERNPEGIRAGFIKSLEGKPGAAAELRANLQAADAEAHAAARKRFADACAKRVAQDRRGKILDTEIVRDVLAVVSQLRNAMRRARARLGTNGATIQPGQGIIEFPETLPVDDVGQDGLAFDPETCRRSLK